MTVYVVHTGDVSDVLPTLGTFDASLCDPPYGFSFLGKQWDRGVPSADVWALVMARLKPGAHLLAFGGPRTQHRLGCAIEDAGFEIRDVLAWMFGSGFPKSHDVSKAIDRAAGAEREVVRANPNYRKEQQDAQSWTLQRSADITAPATPDAQRFEGYGTALKPAYEPVIMARKPFRGSVAANCLEYGTGALNIDGARIGLMTAAEVARSGRSTTGMFAEAGVDWKRDGQTPQGRWPANVVMDPEVGAMLDQQSGQSVSTDAIRLNRVSIGVGGTAYGGVVGFDGARHNDSGGASRFFYCAKASRQEREAGLGHREPTNVNDGRETSIDNAYQRGDTQRRNIHPTIKPVDLNRWLAMLLLPPPRDTPRRILVPFSGAGSEMIGALLAGWDEVVGVELSPEYADIARARLAHWKQYRRADSEAAEKEAAGQGSLFG